MALLLFDGFEGEDMGSAAIWSAYSAGNVTKSAATSKSGSFFYEADAELKGAITPSTKVFVGFAFYPTAAVASNPLCRLYGDGASLMHIGIYTNAARQLEIRRGTGTIVATSTALLTLNVWSYIEVSCTAFSDTVGEVKVRLNGVEVVTFTGDTKNAGTGTNIDGVSVASNITGGSMRFDDVYICNDVDETATCGQPNNTFLGEISVVPLIPTGDGDLNEWSGSDGNSVANWQLVDEVPVVATDYVESGTVGQKDLYATSDLPSNTGTVYGFQVVAQMGKTDAGQAGARLIYRMNGTEVASTEPALSTTAQGIATPIVKNKPGGTGLSMADLNSLQIGAETRTG